MNWYTKTYSDLEAMRAQVNALEDGLKALANECTGNSFKATVEAVNRCSLLRDALWALDQAVESEQERAPD
jgi:hypothetical protein